MDKTNKV